MTATADDIACVVLEQFKKLPAKRKPAVRDNGLREWVPLSGIAVQGPDILECVALATGMKCLPASKLPQANGVAIHDWHAEVLALRAFNRFLLDQCHRLAQDSSAESKFLRRRTPEELSNSTDAVNDTWHRQPFAWREGLTLHMYCSEAPCGDASMELIMSSQADATPWTIPSSLSPSPSPPISILPSNPNLPTHSSTPEPTTTPNPTSTLTSTKHDPPPLLGRGYFSSLGIVRRKPARSDAPPTLSKSCSDKLALKQCASLLNSATALLVSPRGVYLATLVLPASQYDAGACRRCFGFAVGDGNGEGEGHHVEGDDGGGNGVDNDSSGAVDDAGRPGAEPITNGRMAAVRGRVWEGSGYEAVPVRVETTDQEFEDSRRALEAASGNGREGIKLAASNLAVAWTKDGEVEEGLIGGVLQGRKAFDVKGASRTSRRKMWAAVAEVAARLGNDEIATQLHGRTYDDVKEGPLLAARRRVKVEVRSGALKGWHRNTGDGDFRL